MTMKSGLMAAVLMTAACAMQAQVAVKHLQPNEKSPIANGVWAGDTLYLSGQLASPVTPADAAKGTAVVSPEYFRQLMDRRACSRTSGSHVLHGNAWRD